MATKLTLMMRTTTLSTTILRFLGFITFFITTTRAQHSSANYVGDDCHNSNQQALTAAYKANLNSLLSWLSSDAATSKGYNHTSIGTGTADAVYGLYDCRGDVTGTFCQVCISTATSDILQHCPNRSSAVIWYSYCILRYSDQNFIGKVTVSPSWQILGSKNDTDPAEDLKKAESYMQSLIRKATAETNHLYAMGEYKFSPSAQRYGLVQCSRDLTNEQCSQCLNIMLDRVPQCCAAKVGWQVFARSCLIKYDDFMFYQITTQQASASPNPGKF